MLCSVFNLGHGISEPQDSVQGSPVLVTNAYFVLVEVIKVLLVLLRGDHSEFFYELKQVHKLFLKATPGIVFLV